MTDTDRSADSPGDALRRTRAGGRPAQVGGVQGTRSTDEGIVGSGWMNPDWLAEVRTVRDERTGVRKVVEMRLLAANEAAGPGLTTTDLRSVSLTALVEDARAHAGEVAGLLADEAEASLGELRARWRGSARGRNSRRSPLDYAVLAAAYARLVEQGDRRPVATLADELGQSTVTVTQRVREAREQCLLTKVPAGRAGGRLTPKAEALLQTLFADEAETTEDGNRS